MSNVIATTSVVAKTALAILKNNLGFAKNVNRTWESEYGDNMDRGYAPGQTINIDKPPRYTVRDGLVAVLQATNITTVPLTLQPFGADLAFTALERTVSVTADRLKMVVEAAMT